MPHPLNKMGPGFRKSLKPRENTKIISYDIRTFFSDNGKMREGNPNVIQGCLPNLIKYSAKVSGEYDLTGGSSIKGAGG